ncbi:maltokinase N-terminal cap-like domain-containing protein [Kribbella sp.]|uniref:maltokinase N-terminal cap-like domain-containing protein n=1 Tax=Kribbella sp. TaxID=1871183 RepID=UPI002D63846C|nr:aminoglycoside phosphotransferase [Kribbella sp.]HZX06566.1 aminoglycoside phosphotransferase [Kribbella sp.]
MTSHLDQVQSFCATQRWFGEKGHDVHVEALATSAWLSDAGAWPAVRIGFVYCSGPPGMESPIRVYQLPLSYRDEPAENLGHALVGEWVEQDLGDTEVWVYDALHDKEATPYWLDGITHDRRLDGLEFHSVQAPDRTVEVPEGAQSLVLTVEQSNTSLVFGDVALLKVFRRLEPGSNPGVEIESALTEAGSELVPAVLGSARGRWPRAGGGTDTGELAMLTEFQSNATDGWSFATSSVRDLYAEADLHAEEVGGDFAPESHRLGASTAQVHSELAKALGTDVWEPAKLVEHASAMQRRLDHAASVIPELEPYRGGLKRWFDALAAYDQPVTVQRIHGDYHLGQVLRTIDGWKLIDFEGEPAKSLIERRALDTPVKDIAGMLRSFDYAARSLLADHQGDQQIAYRAAEWATRNQKAFCDGYAEVAGTDARNQDVLLNAFLADKVIYEVLYEARNRPTWLQIPLSAAAQLAEQ